MRDSSYVIVDYHSLRNHCEKQDEWEERLRQQPLEMLACLGLAACEVSGWTR